MSSPPPKRKITDFMVPVKKTKTESTEDSSVSVLSTSDLSTTDTSSTPSVSSGNDDIDGVDSIDSYSNQEDLLPKCWRDALDLKNQSFWEPLKATLVTLAKTTEIYPPLNDTMNAFKHCRFDKARVVIIGQDPYHNTGEAMGLCFSVPHGVKVPSSLRNIYKELESDIPGFQKPLHGDLSNWAKQGTLLLNATLTVKAHQANEHSKIGWQHFTDHVVNVLNKQRSHLVWILWGSFAQKKAAKVDKKKNCILESPHPSGLSAHKGFFGCKHFSACNKYLKEEGLTPIVWALPK